MNDQRISVPEADRFPVPLREFGLFGRVPTAVGVDPADVVLAVSCAKRPDPVGGDDELFGADGRKETAGKAERSGAPDASFGCGFNVLNERLAVFRRQQRSDVTRGILSAGCCAWTRPLNVRSKEHSTNPVSFPFTFSCPIYLPIVTRLFSLNHLVRPR